MNKITTLFLVFIASFSFVQNEKDTAELWFGAYADGYYSSNTKEVAYQKHDAIGAYHNNFELNVI
jgi:hypothetical protein